MYTWRSSKVAGLMASITCALACSANAQDVVTVGFNTDNLYRVNLDGSYSTIASIPNTPMLSDVAVINQNNVVATGFQDNTLYNINLNGTYSKIATVPNTQGQPGLNGIAVLDKNNFITVGNNDNKVYLVHSDGSSSTIATIPGNPGLEGVIILDKNNIATVGDNDNKVYRVNLTNGSVTTITTIPGSPELSDIAALNQNSCVTEGFDNKKIYRVNLSDGSFTEVTTLADDAGLDGVTALDQNNIVTVGFQNNAIYRVNLDGTYSLIAIIPNDPGLSGLALLTPLIPTQGLKGNDLKLANYFNKHAPSSTLGYFQNDPDDGLKRAAPTRNALTTFASQTTQLLLSQLLANHLDQKHATLPSSEKQVAFSEENKNLIADNSLNFARRQEPVAGSRKTHFTPWIGLFGDIAEGKEQSQTPEFRTGGGGLMAAFDYNGFSKGQVLGAGLAYNYTHLHEEHGFGHANIAQEAAVIYGTLVASNWYFDLAGWGGYYHAQNSREISFPGFHGISRSEIHGWQFTPHVEIGYDSMLQRGNIWFGIQPYGMVDWVNNWEHGFKEKGSKVFDFEQKGKWCSLLRIEDGLRFVVKKPCDWGIFAFRAKAGYAYQKAFHTGSITAALIGSPGSVGLTTLTTAQNMGVGAMELLFTPKNTKYPFGSIAYQGEFGSKYQSHEVMATLGVNF